MYEYTPLSVASAAAALREGTFTGKAPMQF